MGRCRLLLIVVAGIALLAYFWWTASERPREVPASDEPSPRGEEALRLEGRAPPGAGDVAPPAAESADESALVPLSPRAPGRLGIVFSASLVAPRNPVERAFSSQMDEEIGPAVGYPVLMYWNAATELGGDVVEGRTDDAGSCRLGPLVVPRVPRELRGSVVLVVEGGGGRFALRSISLPIEWVLENLGRPEPAADDGAPVRWCPLGWSDWEGVPVSGRVVDAEGGPVVGMRVFADRFGSQSVTDGHGLFSLRCAPGPLRLSGDSFVSSLAGVAVRNEGFRGVPLHEQILTSEPVRGLELQLPDRVRVRGRVQLPGKLPAANVGVSLRCLSPKCQSMSVETSGNGWFDFIGLDPGARYELRVENERGGYDTVREVTAGDEDVEVVVQTHELHVKLVDALSGRHVPGETSVYDGTRAPGTKLLLLGWARGYGPVEQSYVMGEGFSQTVALKLPPLPPTGRLRVRCLGPDGTRVENPPLRAFYGAEEVLDALWYDEDGYEMTTDIGPGTFTLEIEAPGEARSPQGCRRRVGVPGAGHARFLTGLRKEVTLPASGLLDVDLRPALGGAMSLEVVIEDKSKQRAVLKQPTLTDESGQDVDYLTFQRGRIQNWIEYADASSAVPVGTYRLTMKGKWHKPVEQVVNIQAGRLTHVRIVVEAND